MVKLYYIDCSAPCRAVMMVARALGVSLDLEKVDLFRGEHKTPAFAEINFQGTIPVMDDDGYLINESRAMLTYLVEKYAQDDDSLYPKDLQQRTLVDQRLYFDMGTLVQRFANYYYPMVFVGGEFDDEKLKPLEEALTYLDKFLEATPWAAGDKLTIADISLITTVNNCEVLGLDVNKYPNVSRWLENARETIDGYEEIEVEGANSFKKKVDALAAARGE